MALASPSSAVVAEEKKDKLPASIGVTETQEPSSRVSYIGFGIDLIVKSVTFMFISFVYLVCSNGFLVIRLFHTDKNVVQIVAPLLCHCSFFCFSSVSGFCSILKCMK